MQLAGSVVRRGGRERSSLLEEQQYLAWACLHGAPTLAEIADDRESKRLLIEAHGATQIANVQRGFKDAIGLGAHGALVFNCRKFCGTTEPSRVKRGASLAGRSAGLHRG